MLAASAGVRRSCTGHRLARELFRLELIAFPHSLIVRLLRKARYIEEDIQYGP
jgi:hypothetical protein